MSSRKFGKKVKENNSKSMTDFCKTGNKLNKLNKYKWILNALKQSAVAKHLVKCK